MCGEKEMYRSGPWSAVDEVAIRRMMPAPRTEKELRAAGRDLEIRKMRELAEDGGEHSFHEGEH